MCDVVTLSSDDDEPKGSQPSAHISIVNARPLDPFTLGLGVPTASSGRKGCVRPEQLANALTGVSNKRVRMHHHNSFRGRPSSSNTPFRSACQLSLMHTYNLKKRQRQAALEQALRDQPPPQPREMVPKIRYPSPPRTHPTGLEVDWRRRHNRSHALQNVIAPVDRFVTEARLKNYHFTAMGPAEPDDLRMRKFPHLKFKCTFGSCRRIVVGDYHFVFHLWSHIIAFKEYPDDGSCQPATFTAKRVKNPSYKQSDVDKLARCSECLTRFHLPIQMQVHYTRVHSRYPQAIQQSSCMICEKDVGPGGSEALRKHLLLHSPKDAPYNCRVCKYRTTLRNDLLNHYIESHGNTGTLMCPFCMYTHVIPGNRLNRMLFIMSAFVQHMKDHAERRRIQCSMCACSFTDEKGSRRHEMDHMQIPANWIITQGILPGPKSDIVDPRLKCKDCRILPVTTKNKNDKCDACTESDFWKEIQEREDGLAVDTLAERSVGGPIPAPPGSQFICRCGMKTVDVQKLIKHYDRTDHVFKINQNYVAPKPVPDSLLEINPQEDELEEALMFAVCFSEDPIQMNKDATMRGKYRQKVTAVNPFNLSENPRFTSCKVESYLEAMKFARIVEEDAAIQYADVKEALEVGKTLTAMTHSDVEIDESESEDEEESDENDDGTLGDDEEHDEFEGVYDEQDDEQEDEEQEDEQDEGEGESEGMEIYDSDNGDLEMHGMDEEDVEGSNGMITGDSEMDEEEEDMDQMENIIPANLLTPETEDGDSDSAL